MRLSFRFLFVLFVFFTASCSNYVMVQEQKRQKEQLAAAISGISQKTFAVTVFPITCNSKNPEVTYISKALAEIIANYLKPMMNEVVIIPYEYPTNREIVEMILNSNSMFSNYVTNILTVSTQYVYEVETNTTVAVVITTNSEEKIIDKKKTTTLSFVPVTTTNTSVKTNVSVSGVNSTNMNVLTLERYRELVDTEFPELTNSLSRVPIVVSKDLGLTNLLADGSNDNVIDEVSSNVAGNQLSKISNGNTYKIINDIANVLGIDILNQYSMTIANYLQNSDTNFAFLFGNFTAINTKNGPNEIQLQLTVLKKIDKVTTLKLKLNAREDKVSDKVYDLLKPIRKFFLDRPTGDIALLTDPDGANIYIDGTYVGKSPLYYPAVTAESHQFTCLKPGYNQISLRAEVLEDKTNVIYKTITKLKTGGTVDIDSKPSNANVFIESSYVGNTPLTVTNLTLDRDHRVKIVNTDTNFDLPDYYHTFKLRNENDTYKITANLTPNYELKAFLKEFLWWSTMGGWGITLGFIGLNIYTHYQYEFYYDYYNVYGDSKYLQTYKTYYSLNETTFTGFVISTLVSLGLTGIMLYNNEVYLGLYMDPNLNASAYVCFRY